MGITISVPVNFSVYKGAGQTDKSVIIHGNVSEEVWVAETYISMVNDPAQDELYRDLIAEFRKIRDRERLSGDEYLELISVYTQSLTYESVGEKPAKFPVETVAEGAGDCDDKSLLLAKLLSLEGYSVALLAFVSESHMAVGVGSDDFLFKTTGYTYIETTNLSYVGVPTDVLQGNLTLESDPLVIRIGNGTRTYGSGKETRYINEMFGLTKQKAGELEQEVKRNEADLLVRQNEIIDLKTRMIQLKDSGDIRTYNDIVARHNALVSDYNARLALYRQTFSRYENYVAIHNYILDHQYDRRGVYRYLKTNMPV
jgi:hypothetical protein